MGISISSNPVKIITIDERPVELYEIIASDDITVYHKNTSAVIKKGSHGGLIDMYSYSTSNLSNIWITKGSIVIDSSLDGKFYIGNESRILNANMKSDSCFTVIKASVMHGNFIFDTKSMIIQYSKILSIGCITFSEECDIYTSEITNEFGTNRTFKNLISRGSKIYGDIDFLGELNILNQNTIVASDVYSKHINCIFSDHVIVYSNTLENVKLDGYTTVYDCIIKNLSLIGDFLLKQDVIINEIPKEIKTPTNKVYYSLINEKYSFDLMDKPSKVFISNIYDPLNAIKSKISYIWNKYGLNRVNACEYHRVKEFI